MQNHHYKKIQCKYPINKTMEVAISFVFIFSMFSFGSILFLSLSSHNNYVFAQTQSNTTTNLSATGTSTNNASSPKLHFLGTEHGQIISQRVLELQPFPKMEISFKEDSTMHGINITSIGTFLMTIKSDGTLSGEGKGIDTAKNGDMATWTAQGIGNITSDGKFRLQGTVIHNTNPQGNLSFLNNKIGYIQVEIDNQGKSSTTFWLIQ